LFSVFLIGWFREGETEQFSRFECLKNHKILWHGSRAANFAGILSQGLRIAPPEAPHSGYMFGKGIYHADISSKSAEYCHAETSDNTILMLLNEVALVTSEFIHDYTFFGCKI
jgi:poly [ADP-ribose] polymerase